MSAKPQAARRSDVEVCIMNDTDKPADPPPVPAAEEKPRPEPRPERSPAEPGFGGGRRLKNLDLDLDSEVEAAFGGLSDKDLYAEPARKEPAPAGPDQGRKKARVVQIHGADVFLEVPGGRSGGVLPLLQS